MSSAKRFALKLNVASNNDRSDKTVRFAYFVAGGSISINTCHCIVVKRLHMPANEFNSLLSAVPSMVNSKRVLFLTYLSKHHNKVCSTSIF